MRGRDSGMIAAWAVFLAAGFVLYVLFGYPLLLVWLGRRKRSVCREFQARTVSVVMPVRNGEAWIEAKLKTLAAQRYPAELVEVLVISDGSTDRTAELVRQWPGGRVRLLEVPQGGKALALNAGLAEATGEILFFTDVRQRLGANALAELIANFHDPEVGVVSGELVILEGESQEEASVGAYWRYEKWIRCQLSGIDSVLGATGAIYAMRRGLARPLPAGTLLDDVYLPLAAFFAGYRVTFEPLALAYDEPTSLAGEFRRKVRTLAGNYQLLASYPQLLHPGRNRMWIHYLSHKFGRLLLPWALITVALASFFLPDSGRWPWGRWLLVGQAAFYGLAALDFVLPDKSRAKKLSSPVRTFVVLMAASAGAISYFFVPAESLWTTVAAGKGPGKAKAR